MIYFNLGQYRCAFGPSSRQGATIHAPSIPCNAVWMWNGYYWQIEIAEAYDFESAKHAMSFIIADRKLEMELAEKRGKR